MEASRVGSFDDEMYKKMKGLEFLDSIEKTLRIIAENDRRKFQWILEQDEQRIADSHDITKSNFGFKLWQK